MSRTHAFSARNTTPVNPPLAPPQFSRLARKIEGQIEQRARGRVRDLRVECFAGLVVLQGRTRTYHVKQIAQEAALDLLDDTPRLTNKIVVS